MMQEFVNKINKGYRKASGKTRCFSFGRIMKFDYGSDRWKRKAKAIKQRDRYMCVRCRRYGKMRPAKVVHHIQPVDEHPELAWEDSNLESLCMACHNQLHPEKAIRKNRGYRK